MFCAAEGRLNASRALNNDTATRERLGLASSREHNRRETREERAQTLHTTERRLLNWKKIKGLWPFCGYLSCKLSTMYVDCVLQSCTITC